MLLLGIIFEINRCLCTSDFFFFFPASSGLNSVFGAHLVTPDGYVLNNAMTSFYNDPSFPNNLGDKAGQRPLQGLLPVIATESGGRCGTRFVTGAADATLLAQVIMNILQFNQSAADAIRSPRIHAKPQTSVLDLEGTSFLCSSEISF